MIIASATFGGSHTYELHRSCTRDSRTPPPGSNAPFWWEGFEGWYETPAAAVEALWQHLGIAVAVEGWWKPVIDGLDISAARRPVTVTEQELLGGDALVHELWEIGLALEAEPGAEPTRAHRALAHRQLQRHYEQLTAEELLEQVALAHDLECELIEPAGEHVERFWIVPADQADRDPACMEPLAIGDTPLAAVLELQRDLLHHQILIEAGI